MRVDNPATGSSAFAIRPHAFLFLDPGGRPGPRRRLRRRPRFFALFPVETLPSSDWIAERTSCCTMSRMTVSKVFCLGIDSSLPAPDTRKPITSKVGGSATGVVEEDVHQNTA